MGPGELDTQVVILFLASKHYASCIGRGKTIMSDLIARRWLEKCAVSREKVAETWCREGYDRRLWIDTPGQEWIDFVHSTDELVVLLEGDLEVEVAGQRAHVQPGDGVFIPAGARHSVFNRGATLARWLFGYKQER